MSLATSAHVCSRSPSQQPLPLPISTIANSCCSQPFLLVHHVHHLASLQPWLQLFSAWIIGSSTQQDALKVPSAVPLRFVPSQGKGVRASVMDSVPFHVLTRWLSVGNCKQTPSHPERSTTQAVFLSLLIQGCATHDQVYRTRCPNTNAEPGA